MQKKKKNGIYIVEKRTKLRFKHLIPQLYCFSPCIGYQPINGVRWDKGRKLTQT